MSIEDDILRAFHDSLADAELRARGAQPGSRAPGADSPEELVVLPRVRGRPGVLIQDEETAVLFFDCEDGRRIRLPIDGHSLPLLADAIRYLLNAGPDPWPTQTSDEAALGLSRAPGSLHFTGPRRRDPA